MENFLPDIASTMFFLTFAIYSVLVIFMLIWLFHDAESRGVMGWVIIIPAFLTGTILVTVLWLMFRPSIKTEPALVRVRNN
jgi:heme/copper-type cytochrome/quinol oxidase subunit 4